jgi:hypothetical protein
MASIRATYSQYVPPNTASQLLHTGSGKVLAIIASTSNATAETLILYDNTAASGNVLMRIALTAAAPAIIFFPPILGLQFSTGLTAASGANLSANVITQF